MRDELSDTRLAALRLSSPTVEVHRKIGLAFLLSLVLGVLGVGAASAAVERVDPGTASGAQIVKTGWWWKTNDTSQFPAAASPGTDALPPAPPPKNVPEGALPASAVLGDAEKLSAIEFSFDAEPGAVVSSFVLSLRESKEPGANAGADAEGTRVVACSVTEPFWSDGEAAAWRAKPDFDDGNCQPGERGADGVWTFDLTSFAVQWLGQDNQTSGSVVLVEQVDQPESFQVAFDGIGNKGIGVALVATPGPSNPGNGGSENDDAAIGTGDSGSAPEDFSSDLAGGAPEAAPVELDAAPEGAEIPVAAPADADVPQPQAAPVAQPFLIAPSALEDIPAGIWILAPIVLGLAYLSMLALGPAGEPATATARRGVSRALEQWRSGGRRTGGAR
ncbi:hypothetical protein [Amycolatopsis palatopharyngis]|uniref:hypothetical protein n=1 Tax=Amycolatopsis palatopharyngis TaxID=187982 RepID=UPI0013BE9FC8|nr:hypothetical protein [Amycolatopsis palatopharyngis]